MDSTQEPKELNLVEVAEFAKARRLNTELEICWWVPYTLRKRDVILSAIFTDNAQVQPDVLFPHSFISIICLFILYFFLFLWLFSFSFLCSFLVSVVCVLVSMCLL